MFGRYVFERSPAAAIDKILIIDEDNLEAASDYSRTFVEHGFEWVVWKDDLTFRIDYGEKLEQPDVKLAVLAAPGDYIPYDIRKKLRLFSVSFHALFPSLNADVLRQLSSDELDLLSEAYKRNYRNLCGRKQTEQFIADYAHDRSNVRCVLDERKDSLIRQAESISGASSWRKWFSIAEEKASVDVMAAGHDVDIDTSEISNLFRDWVLKHFSGLTSQMDQNSPVTVSRVMEYMSDRSGKFVLIVMDGMSVFDWYILSASFSEISYRQAYAYAMIPTITSISRQCLLSNKLPVQLEEPWKQSKEKAEFTLCAKESGFTDKQISYLRGYDAEFGPLIRCGTVIINDVDDMVHGQMQGRKGMYNDISMMAKEGKLVKLVHKLLAQGFDVYISADHGNTPCTGIGKKVGSGVETETKGHRMVVLKGIADKEGIKQKYGMLEYPKYYLMKEYDYLICDTGKSLDTAGERVMSHGGITIDEVIVPFIQIKAVENHA